MDMEPDQLPYILPSGSGSRGQNDMDPNSNFYRMHDGLWLHQEEVEREYSEYTEFSGTLATGLVKGNSVPNHQSACLL